MNLDSNPKLKLLALLAFPAVAIAALVIMLSWSQGSPDRIEAADPAVLDFSLQLEKPGVGVICDTNNPGQKAECKLNKGDVYVLTVILKDAKPYVAWNAQIFYGGQVVAKGKPVDFIWPDCVFEAWQFLSGKVSFGCSIGIGGLPSSYVGPLASLAFNCDPTGAGGPGGFIDLVHGQFDTGLQKEIDFQWELNPADEMNIDCNAPPKPTPVPAVTEEVTALCRPADGSPDDPLKCKYNVGDEVTIVGTANFAQDNDKNGTAGYHGVDVQVTWPAGLGDDEKRSGVVCPPGGVETKEPILVVGKWAGGCHLGTQLKAAEIPPCPVTLPDPTPTPKPDSPPNPPGPGCDLFDSNAAFEVTLTNPALGPLTCELAGPVQVARYNNPVSDPKPAVKKPGSPTTRAINTQITFMQLTGACTPGVIPVTVRIRDAADKPFMKSTGQVWENTPGTLATDFFPAESFFDVFFEFDTPVGTLHNNVAMRIECLKPACSVTALPPIFSQYIGTNVVEVFDETNKLVGTVEGHTKHTPQKTLVGPSEYIVVLNCVTPGTHTVNVSATFTREAKDQVGPVPSSVQINCNATANEYNRIVVDVGKPDINFKVDNGSFTCQKTGETVPAVFKVHEDNVNPGDAAHADHEVWSGTFSAKCIGLGNGVGFTLTPVDPNNALLIKECRMENTTTGALALCVVTPNPGMPPGPQDFKAIVPGKLAGPGDTDGDGCSDVRENQPKSLAVAGGGRNYLDVWDYGDMPDPNLVPQKNQRVRIPDIVSVVERFGMDDDNNNDGVPDKPFSRYSDPLSKPAKTGYHPAYDRGGQVGANPWNQAPANGTIRIPDIVFVVNQFGHDCI